MAVTIVAYQAIWASGLGATQTFPTQSVAAGDLLAAIYFADKVDILPTTAPSDNLNGSWTKQQILAGSLVDYLTATAGSDSCRVACAFKKNSAAGSMELSLPWANDAGTPVRKAAYLFVVSGLAGGGDIDQCIGQAYAAVTGTTISAGTFATFPQANTACVMGYEGSRVDSGILGSWTRATDMVPWLSLRGGSQVSSSTTGFEAGWNKASNSLDGVAVAMSFKDATSAPTISSPTGASITATGITAGFTTTAASAGTCYFLRRVGGSAASAATIVSSGESQVATANPQTRAMTGFTAGSTSNYVDMAHANSGNSNVVTYGPFTMLPAFAGTIPAKSGTNGTTFAWGSPAEASYFTGATSYSTTPALTLGLSINSGTGAITGTLSSVSSWTGVINGTNSQGSVSSNSFTITSNAAAPGLSVPTKSTPTSTTAVVGATTDNATGTMRAVLTLDNAQPSIAQVKAGQDAAGSAATTIVPTALTITTSGAKSFSAATVVSGTTRYGWIVHTESGGADSSVLAVGAIYPGTWRPSADVTVSGWTVTGAGSHAAALSEDAPGSDAEYSTSPTLSASPSVEVFDLSDTLPAGSYTVSVRANVSTGSGFLKVELLNGGGTVQGTSADQATTTTLTTYALPITTTGAATRVRMSVWI